MSSNASITSVSNWLSSQADMQGIVTISLTLGFLAIIAYGLYVMAPATITVTTITTIAALIGTPFAVVVGFYFGSKVASSQPPVTSQ